MIADALRTDMRAFRKLVLAEAMLAELRKGLRMADDLAADKNRVANRLREQPWRYYPGAVFAGEAFVADRYAKKADILTPPGQQLARGCVMRNDDSSTMRSGFTVLVDLRNGRHPTPTAARVLGRVR
jgi:hypothetical protein